MAQHNDKTATSISTNSSMRPRAWSMSLEGFKSFCEIAGVVVLFFTFLFGAGALISANRLNAIKDKELEQLKGKVSDNEKDAAQLKKDAAILTKEAEDERLARVEIEDAVAWRRLTKDQISEMGTDLAVFPRQLTALVYNVSDLEAYSFATDIDVALHEFAKWNIAEPQAIIKMREGPVNFGTNPPLERGVVVNSTSDERSRAAAKALVDKLSLLGFDAVIGVSISKETHTLQISVEPRPEGPQGAAKLRAKGKHKP